MMIIIFTFVYTDVNKSSISLYKCVNVGDEFLTEKRLIEDLSVDCSTSNHYKWIFFGAIPI